MAIRWAVIGATGLMGTKAVPDGIMAAANCELAAVQGLYEREVKPWAEKWGAPGFTSAEEMLDKVPCDAVYVASPQNAHLEHVGLAAKRGRHVLCEKPLAPNSDEAKEMVEACERGGVKLGIGFNQRFNPPHIKARELIAEGVIGEVVSARCQYGNNFPPNPALFRQVAKLAGGGSMVDLGVHVLDLVEFVIGRRFDTVMAVAKNVIHKYEVEDCCGALLEFDGGGFAFVDSYYNVSITLLRNDLEVNGSKGALYTVGSLIGMETGGKLVVVTDEFRKEYDFDGPDMYKAEFEAFASAILEDREPPCDGLDGLRNQYLLDAIYASARVGTKVDVRAIPLTEHVRPTDITRQR